MKKTLNVEHVYHGPDNIFPDVGKDHNALLTIKGLSGHYNGVWISRKGQVGFHLASFWEAPWATFRYWVAL